MFLAPVGEAAAVTPQVQMEEFPLVYKNKNIFLFSIHSLCIILENSTFYRVLSGVQEETQVILWLSKGHCLIIL